MTLLLAHDWAYLKCPRKRGRNLWTPTARETLVYTLKPMDGNGSRIQVSEVKSEQIIMLPSPEEKFYKIYAGTKTKNPTASTAEEFYYGKRYYICNRSIKNDIPTRSELIVELGCGDGQRLLWLQQQYRFKSAHGFDLGFEAEQADGISNFIPANLNSRWPIEDGAADVLVAMMILEHLFDPQFCFREVARTLHPKGRAFINLPLVTSLKNRLRLLFGQLPITSVPYGRWLVEGHWDGFHLHYFNMQSVFDLAKDSGLIVVSVEGVGKMKKLKDLAPSILCGEISFELRHRKSG